MRFSVDAWDPAYGTSFEVADDDSDGMDPSSAAVEPGVEMPAAEWRPVPPRSDVTAPATVLFVDGVRRVDAHVWIEGDGPSHEHRGGATAGICASYAAGVVTCSRSGAQVGTVEVRRGLFTPSPSAADLLLPRAAYPVHPAEADDTERLSLALQRRLGEAEVACALAARGGVADADDLLVVDGPLRGRAHLPRVLGMIKSHRSTYLPPELNGLVVVLAPGERTPAFRMGTSWRRHSWYLRLPGRPGAPWAGVVRVECSADLAGPAVVALADLSQVVLPRYASVEYKDQRAPQNLYPIGGLERLLRRRLGDPSLLNRALRQAAYAG